MMATSKKQWFRVVYKLPLIGAINVEATESKEAISKVQIKPFEDLLKGVHVKNLEMLGAFEQENSHKRDVRKKAQQG